MSKTYTIYQTNLYTNQNSVYEKNLTLDEVTKLLRLLNKVETELDDNVYEYYIDEDDEQERIPS